MGYNDVMACGTVINLTGSISSDKSRSIGFLIIMSGRPYIVIIIIIIIIIK